MDESTRRNFLIVAGVGAAAATGAAVVATSAGAAPAGPVAAPTALPGTASAPLVAYVQDIASGRVSVMVGESEVVVHDPDLVARIAVAATGKKA